jgi:GNAT superfamily N-acetyltransferase
MSLISAFGGRYLDHSFTTRFGARVRILERPGRWMDAAALAGVVEDLRAVVRRSLSREALEYGVVTGDKGRLDCAILTLVYGEEDGRPVAFNALSIMDCELRGRPVEVLHLGLVMVDPGYRSRGLSAILYGLTSFLVFARRRMRPMWISNVTQVPSIVGMVSESFDRVFPAPDPAARRSWDHLSLARQILGRHRHVFGVGPEAGFDEERFVITDAYTGGSDNLKKTFAEAPKHRTPVYNEMCERELDYARGDDFLQLGQFTLGAAREHFTRFRSVLSPAGLVMNFAFLLLDALVAPLLQWFDPARPMGDLRPWKETPA